MKNAGILIVALIITTVMFSCKTIPPAYATPANSILEGKIIVKSFAIDTAAPYEAQKALEKEQARLMKLFPDLNLLGYIQGEQPWVLITERCLAKADYETVLNQIVKECPNAKVVPCSYNE